MCPFHLLLGNSKAIPKKSAGARFRADGITICAEPGLCELHELRGHSVLEPITVRGSDTPSPATLTEGLRIGQIGNRHMNGLLGAVQSRTVFRFRIGLAGCSERCQLGQETPAGFGARASSG